MIHALKSRDSPRGSSRDSFYLRPWNSYRRGFRGCIVVQGRFSPPRGGGGQKIVRLHYVKWRILSVSWLHNVTVIVLQRVWHKLLHDEILQDVLIPNVHLGEMKIKLSRNISRGEYFLFEV